MKKLKKGLFLFALILSWSGFAFSLYTYYWGRERMKCVFAYEPVFFWTSLMKPDDTCFDQRWKGFVLGAWTVMNMDNAKTIYSESQKKRLQELKTLIPNFTKGAGIAAFDEAFVNDIVKDFNREMKEKQK